MALITRRAKEGQSVLDINLMYYSGFDSLVKFCKDNGIDNLNALDVSGKDLVFDTALNPSLSATTIVDQKGFTFTTGVFVDGYRVTEAGNYRVTSQGYTRVLQL